MIDTAGRVKTQPSNGYANHARKNVPGPQFVESAFLPRKPPAHDIHAEEVAATLEER